jgi:molybdenum cofactor cytidylyltransferase
MTGIIILAAGSSSGLGTPKQNLVYKGKTLLQRAIDTAMASVCEPVIVVLGANSEVIRPAIENNDVIIVQNDEWKEGMSSSIRTGIMELQRISPDIKSVILMLCDQPFIDTYLLNMLIVSKSKHGIIVSAFNDTIGPPVLFDAVYFHDLLSLKGAEGAKTVVQKYPTWVTEIPFPQGGIDIDTMEDFEEIVAPEISKKRDY